MTASYIHPLNSYEQKSNVNKYDYTCFSIRFFFDPIMSLFGKGV